MAFQVLFRLCTESHVSPTRRENMNDLRKIESAPGATKIAPTQVMHKSKHLTLKAIYQLEKGAERLRDALKRVRGVKLNGKPLQAV